MSWKRRDEREKAQDDKHKNKHKEWASQVAFKTMIEVLGR
jgi:hypothetical protein